MSAIASAAVSGPRRSIQPTSGSSASARKSAITTQASTWRAIQITSRTIADREHDQQDPQDRARTQVDHALRRHHPSIAGWSDVVTLPVMSLRTTPAVEHAALPGGGTVTVWVGVPDDPYFDDKSQLTTVDVQLHEGGADRRDRLDRARPGSGARGSRARARSEGCDRGRRDRIARARARAVRRPPALAP